MAAKIVEVHDLVKYFPIKGGVFQKTIANVKAVDGVSFYIQKGETFGLVGESGCGKTTAGRCVLRLIEPTKGKIIFNGIEITNMKEKELRRLRPKMQIIFQDPYSSLNPRLTIKDIVGEAMVYHGIVSSKDSEKKSERIT